MELLTLDLYILLFPPLDIKYVTLNIWLHIMETFQYKCTACMALFKSRSVRLPVVIILQSSYLLRS